MFVSLFPSGSIVSVSAAAVFVLLSAPAALYYFLRKRAGRVIRALLLISAALLLPAAAGNVRAQGETCTQWNETVTDWDSLSEAMKSDGCIRLTRSVNAGGSDLFLVVPAGKTVTLDLNGQTIDRGLQSVSDYGNVLYVYGKLTLTGSGTITGGNANDLGGGVAVFGNFTMEGGTISGNSADRQGGGVGVYGGTFTMKGGTISRNSADTGGGVWVYGGTFTMEGGTISGNSADYGGGVLVVDDGAFTMSGGTITGNLADRQGGGVYVDRSMFSLSGGKITGNVYGGEWDEEKQIYYAEYYANCPGDPYCYQSTIYLGDYDVITVTGPLNTSGGPIGISMENSGVFTSGLKGNGDAESFRSEDTRFSIRLNSRGEAVLANRAVSKPEITPQAGTYIGPQTVTITCSTGGSSVWYTTDGSDPTQQPIRTTGNGWSWCRSAA